MIVRAWLLVWLGVAFVPTLLAQDDAYERTVHAALRELAEGRARESYALFRRAHELRPSARTERGLATASFEAGDYVMSVEHAERALASEEQPLTDEMRAEVTGIRERARAFVGTLRPSDPSTTLWVDGRRQSSPATVGLGDHVVEVRDASGQVQLRSEIRIRGGEELEIEVPATETTVDSRPADSGSETRAADSGFETRAADSGFETRAADSRALDTRAVDSRVADSGADRALRTFRATTVVAAVLTTAAGAWALERMRSLRPCDTRECTNEGVLRRQHVVAWVTAAALLTTTLGLTVATLRRGRRTHELALGTSVVWRLVW